MDVTSNPSSRPQSRTYAAAVIALIAVAVITAAWFWMSREIGPAEVALPHGVIVLGAGALVTALVAHVRSMSLPDVLEMLWALIAGFFALLGAMLKGLWDFVCDLLGW